MSMFSVEVPVGYLPLIVLVSVGIYATLSRAKGSIRWFERETGRSFVEGGHYLVWYYTEEGFRRRAYLIVDELSSDGLSICRRLGPQQTIESCHPASWMGVSAYTIESVIRLPPPPDVGDTRGSYRGG